MTINLTLHQKLKHYSISAFLLILSLSPFILDFSNSGKDLAYLVFLIAAVVCFLIKKNQLNLKEFEINTTLEDFHQAIKITTQQNEWKIKKNQ